MAFCNCYLCNAPRDMMVITATFVHNTDIHISEVKTLALCNCWEGTG